MIISNINDKTTTFICHNEYLKEVFDWLKKTNLNDLKVGKYDLNHGIFVKIQEYNTKDESEGRFENHEKHLDFHYLISGEEITRVTNPQKLDLTDDHLDSDDVAHYARTNDTVTSIVIHPGDYIILFPEDAHEACLKLSNSVPCKKAVIKVPIDLLLN
ncbi:YhcH/YjgK/YiaL family protein [Lactobacillus crispatus]|uniref:DUF386 family protein n=1 Tax=Lactobacillus crispatus TaxID=47770 RepID=A0A7H9E8L1_9LACO|nr:YhcH/YjgK/YiaL family protein [Lactobacillus crispatus]QLL73522.1 DUF386 family protein [Lactobacillus crispatus]